MSAGGAPLSSVEVSAGEPGTVIVRLGGELDLSGVPAVEAEVERVLAGSPSRLVIDVSELRFADSSAIALWVRWAMAIEQFELRDPSPFVRRVLGAMGLDERLGVQQ